MKNNKLLKTLCHIVTLQEKLSKLYESKEMTEEMNGRGYCVENKLFNCTEKNGCLYDCKGNLLATGGIVDDLYYCNQHTGYMVDDLYDDFYGIVYYKIRKGVFVKVSFGC